MFNLIDLPMNISNADKTGPSAILPGTESVKFLMCVNLLEEARHLLPILLFQIK